MEDEKGRVGAGQSRSAAKRSVMAREDHVDRSLGVLVDVDPLQRRSTVGCGLHGGDAGWCGVVVVVVWGGSGQIHHHDKGPKRRRVR